MKSILAKFFTVALLAVVTVACGGDEPSERPKDIIEQKGSDTMILLAQKWAEEFGAGHADVSVLVSGGGSGNGISALINGTTNIANASRPMKESEREQIKQKYGVDVVEIPVAKDGITVYVHETNPVEALSIAQLEGIYTGKVTNWSEVGGNDGRIILYGRENSSGTYEFFKEHVLNKQDFAPETQTLSGTAAVVNGISQDANGIGYGGHAYLSGVKPVKLMGEDGTAVEATEENVRSGVYPLARDLYLYLREQPTGSTKEYIDWILSDSGQAIVTKIGYYPVK